MLQKPEWKLTLEEAIYLDFYDQINEEVAWLVAPDGIIDPTSDEPHIRRVRDAVIQEFIDDIPQILADLYENDWR